MKSVIITVVSTLFVLNAFATENPTDGGKKNRATIAKVKTQVAKPKKSVDLIEENFKKQELSATVVDKNGTIITYEPYFVRKTIKLSKPKTTETEAEVVAE